MADDNDFGGDDLDAEFFKMVADVTPSTRKFCRALVLSPIDSPGALRAALDMVGSPAPVVSLGRTSAVYLEVEVLEGEADQDAEMLALLEEEPPLPAEVDEMGKLLSKLSSHGSVAIASWTTEEASGTENGAPDVNGTIAARRYVNGKVESALPSGLVLAGLDLSAEELLLGRITPEQVNDYREPGPWTGWLKGRGKR